MGYEELLIEADGEGLIVKEKPLQLADGLIMGKKIAIRNNIRTTNKKADVLAEELGHHYTTSGNILGIQNTNDEKQERSARLWSYNKRIGLTGILEAYRHHCKNQFEAAEYLEVSEDTLVEALECYRQIYGYGVMIDNYFIQFEPNLQVYDYYQFTKQKIPLY